MFLDKVNYGTVSSAIIQSLVKIKIDFSNVVTFTTDNASYMLKAFNTVLKPVLFNCSHVTCFAHIVALLGEVWRSGLPNLDSAIACLKSIFVRSNQRKRRFVEFLKDNSAQNPSNFPIPVETRWNTWFISVEFLAKHYDLVVKFVDKELETEENSALLKLKSLFLNEEIKNQAIFISDNCHRLKKTILIFEESNYNSTNVYDIVNDLYFWLISEADKYDSNDFKNLLLKHHQKNCINTYLTEDNPG